jgi:hypothetical protein
VHLASERNLWLAVTTWRRPGLGDEKVSELSCTMGARSGQVEEILPT